MIPFLIISFCFYFVLVLLLKKYELRKISNIGLLGSLLLLLKMFFGNDVYYVQLEKLHKYYKLKKARIFGK